ncbi:heavy-metal-associated domain-containing protein [Clostridium cylindrosporum]|uniref:Copper chaperone CopZ n=1 Tax=Clostridium cylindrosporum DSM 605 TaxID=1121307 RepID=A0A0J8DDG8_CLOCY|nr:cation transporter [Clostridium cylindrosporum]KMT22279.1 copper chaperone CopZ [Clostridium cylindrosporum DSM 605]
MKKKILIEGMSCGHCVNHVKEALEGISGTSEVEVNLEGKYATLETSADDATIKEVIEEEGYDVVGIE